MTNELAKLSVRVARRDEDASGAVRFELAPIADELPPFDAGAHIDIFLPNGLVRSYSLMNPQHSPQRYVCGIGLDQNSRGGSAYMHEQVREGAVLSISPPKNNFPLAEDAAQSVMFAGGIGVTPIIGMIERLNALGHSWTLNYCARSRATGPFFDLVSDLGPDVRTHFDDEADGGFMDVCTAVLDADPDAHFYCCGPIPMITAFEKATAHLPPERVHIERFSSDQALATEGGFTVELTQSGLSLWVPSGKTILETIEAAGVEVPFSCLAGICGSCVTKVVEGIPDHRDMVLTDREKSRNDQMMICCSGSLSDRLILER